MLGGGDGGFSSYYYGCIKTFLVQTRKSLTGPGVHKCTPERLHCRTLDDLKRMGAAERPLDHPLTLLSRRQTWPVNRIVRVSSAARRACRRGRASANRRGRGAERTCPNQGLKPDPSGLPAYAPSRLDIRRHGAPP